MAPTGICLVNSGITAKDTLDLETFTRWYEDIHIRDILTTSGIQTAYRFKSSTDSPKPGTVISARPFLALYPLNTLSWAADDNSEMWKLSVSHDMLPSANNNIFELAEFQMGLYEKLGSTGGEGIAPAKSIVIVSVDPEEAVSRAADDLEGLLRGSITLDGGDAPTAVRSTLFKWTYAPPGLPTPADMAPGTSLIASYLAIVSAIFWEIFLMG